MKFDMIRPCNNCPFRTNYHFPLTQGRVEEIIDSITRRDESFACHKHTKFDEDGVNIPHRDDQHCAGALIMLEHMNNPNQIMRIAERLGLYDRHNLDMSSPVYKTGARMMAAGHWTDRPVTVRPLAPRRPKPRQFGVARPLSK